MSRTNVRFVKPALEQLEERAQPSFLLGGGVQQLATPLNNMVADMNSAATDLKSQVTPILNNTAPANTYAGAETNLAKAVADWQRILNDQHSIQAFSGASVNFINAVALSEAASGDFTDLIVLRFGGLLGLHPLNALTTPVTQANNIATDTTLQSMVNTNFHAVNIHIDSTNTIAQDTTVPTF